MPTGIVKWFNGRKGYGFIEPEDGGNDVFVHVTALKDSGIKFLNEGDKVSYELTENRGRMAAGNLTLDGEGSTESTDADDDQLEESAAEESSDIVVETKESTLKEGLGLNEDIINEIKDAVTKTFGIRLPQIGSKEFKKVLQDNYRNALFKIIKNFVGTRAKYKSFLEKNWKKQWVL